MWLDFVSYNYCPEDHLSKNVLYKSYETMGNIALREKVQSHYGRTL